MLSQLQPIPIEDCLPFFRELHSQFKDIHTDSFGVQSKNWTDISFCLRLSYTESLMNNNKFAFLILTDKEANIVGIDLDSQDATRAVIPAPPSELAKNSETIQQMFSLLLALEVQSFIEDGFIFGETQKRLSQYLA